MSTESDRDDQSDGQKPVMLLPTSHEPPSQAGFIFGVICGRVSSSFFTFAIRNRKVMFTLLLALAFVGRTIAMNSSVETETSPPDPPDVEKYFDVNAPPVLLLENEQVSKEEASVPLLGRKQISMSEAISTRNGTSAGDAKLPFPIIDADDDTIPTSSSTSVVHAADALECRESVINYVINATDAKDECEGLKKAFDTTCTSDSAEKIRANADSANPQGRRRLFQTSKKSGNMKLFAYQLSRSLHQFIRTYFHARDEGYFFAEHEIMGNAWTEAKFQVENDFDLVVHEEVRRKLKNAEDSENGNAFEITEDAERIVVNPTETQLMEDFADGDDDGVVVTKPHARHADGNQTGTSIEDSESNGGSMGEPIELISGNSTATQSLEDVEIIDTSIGEAVEIDSGNATATQRSETFEGKDGSIGEAIQVASGNSTVSDSEVEDGFVPKGENIGLDSEPTTVEVTVENPEGSDFELAGENDTATNALEESEDVDGFVPRGEFIGLDTEPPIEKKPDKPKQSLSLPTSSQHVSGQMLSETLMLQQEDDMMAALKASSNQTNATFSDAQVDAMASSKAVSDTTAAVSAVLNDPTSVEARTCCASILNVFHENCDVPGGSDVTDKKLFLIVFIIAFCGMVKSLIRHFQVRWLPEAAGCILVGVVCGMIMSFIPHYDLSFDGDSFLRIMVPPIVFEAALSIDKRSFNRHLVPILFYAVAGTLFATVMTAFIVHKGTLMLGGLCETIPYVESLAFGALISSIDPIAVLSVLSNIGMTDTDTIYVVIFGESLLNDGVSIVLFQTLEHFLDESLVIDSEAVSAAAIHFFLVASGSVSVGIISGVACTFYYYAFHGCQTPLVEVLMFFCWAFIPYYICDGVEWSGIVAVVTTGFVMDLYVVGQDNFEHAQSPRADDNHHNVTHRRIERQSCLRRIFSRSGHLSAVARTHVGFVTEILSTMMETAIFAYLGFFLFSYRYHWNVWHTLLSIFACCVSRAIMIPVLSLLANFTTTLQRLRNNCRSQVHTRRNSQNSTSGVVIDSRMQVILWFAGLRGAMSFALVENIPLYDAVTGVGSRLKPELKAMTSASIVFTVFVLGGYTYYMIERLGMTPSVKASTVEMASLIKRPDGTSSGDDDHFNRNELSASERMFRQRPKGGADPMTPK